MTLDLAQLLAKARDIGGPSTMAPGVFDVEAHVAAWHAITLQGGMTSPVREAWRLSVDKRLTDRHVLSDPAWMNSQDDGRPVDLALVRSVVDADVAATAPVNAIRAQKASPAPGYLPPEKRGEGVDAKGKLFHLAVVTVGGDGNYEQETVQHVGSWLTCEACNPVQVVNANTVTEARPVLIDLRAEYADAKAAADAADERLKAAKAKLQTALSEATNGALRSALHVPGYLPLTLTYGERWTVDSKRLKAEQPVTYVQYAKLGSSWTLQESKESR